MKQSSNLDFNGMAGDGVNRGKNRLAGNNSGLTALVHAINFKRTVTNQANKTEKKDLPVQHTDKTTIEETID